VGRGSERKRTKEHYYREAKKQGYRARSAFKLKQIIRKYKLLDGVDRVVELCSSPGGWTQIIRELDGSIQIVAVDLDQMPPIQGVKFVQGDILEDETLEKIALLIGGAADLVLSDCSPKVTGQWELDVARQLALAEGTLNLARRMLTPKGKVLTKVFQGPGFQEFLGETRKQFNSVKLVKPDASRKSSAEIYMLAVGPKMGQKPDNQSSNS
jgi:23S rRNA (uridine2552-2'-O)-methyltransferase